MEVYFKPEKKWQKPWTYLKRNRYLTQGKDYEISDSLLILVKPLKGRMEVSYDGKLN